MAVRSLALATVVAVAVIGPASVANGQSRPAAPAGVFEVMHVLRPATPEAAPDVVFRTLDGREAGLRELRGRPVLVSIFTTW